MEKMVKGGCPTRFEEGRGVVSVLLIRKGGRVCLVEGK